MKKLFVFGDSYSDWCNKDIESHQNGETLREEDFWFHKLADYKNLELWNYGRSGYGVGGCFREFMTFCDLISEDDLVIFGFGDLGLSGFAGWPTGRPKRPTSPADHLAWPNQPMTKHSGSAAPAMLALTAADSSPFSSF